MAAMQAAACVGSGMKAMPLKFALPVAPMSVEVPVCRSMVYKWLGPPIPSGSMP